MVEDDIILELIGHESSFEKGFRLLVNTYQQKLYYHVRRIVDTHENADDVLQNTFVKVYKNIANFEAKSKLYTWMYRIATNEALTYRKKMKMEAQHHGDIDELKNMVGEVSMGLESDQLLSWLKLAIDSLPNKQKIVFNMRYYDEMSYSQMSEILATSEGALKASYHHAVKKVEQIIKDKMIAISN